MVRKTFLAILLVVLVGAGSVAADEYFEHLSEGRKLFVQAQQASGAEAQRLFQRALKELDAALAAEAKPGAQYFRGLCLMELGMYREAKEMFDAVSQVAQIPGPVRAKLPGLLEKATKLIPTQLYQITIETTPAGAEVYLDAKNLGVSPVTAQRRSGSYALLAKKKGYQDTRETITVRTEDVRKSITLLVKKPKLILETGKVAGASVAIDGKKVGRTPLTVEWNPGSHTIVVSKEGYHKWSQTIELKAGINVQRVVKLVPLPPKGPSGLAIGGYVSLGVGGAAVIAGGALHGLAVKDADSSNEAGQPWSDADSSYNAAKGKMNGAYAMYAIGGAAVVTGVVLVVYDAVSKPKSTKTTQRSTIFPAATPGGALLRF